MDYFGRPKWRWLLVVPIIFTLPLFFGPLTLITFGTFRGVAVWEDLMKWAHYEDKDY